MNDEFVIAGFQGELLGNEKRVQRRLPLFARAHDGRVIFVARHLDWTDELRETDVLRVSADRAPEYGEVVKTDQPIKPGQYVIVMGPEFIKATMVITKTLTDEQSSAIDGFSYQPMSESVFENFVSIGDRAARAAFDSELAAGVTTDAARAALLVIWGIGTRDYRGAVIRDLAAAYLAPDADRFRRLMRIASARLGDTPEKIKAEMIDYLAIIRRDTTLLERAEREVVTAPSR